MFDQWAFRDAVFAHWKGGITVFGFAYKTADGIESGSGYHTKVDEAWIEAVCISVARMVGTTKSSTGSGLTSRTPLMLTMTC
jgi:hypothetical protein